MHLQKMLNKIAVYIAVASIAITSLAVAVPMHVSAQTAATDDNGNNIIKVLDMALNKSGISASPSTIQNFLDYMHDSVTAGARAWSDLSGSVYESVSDYVSACKGKVADSDNIPDSAKSLINGYLDYMGKCTDTRANFDAGYSNAKNFRNYLMSYVTDVEDKQLTGAISKNNKYNLKGGLVNLVRQNMDAYIEEYEGYYLVPTLTYKDVDLTRYSKKVFYQLAYDSLKTIPDDKLIFYWGLGNVVFQDITGFNFVGTLNDNGCIYLSNGIYDDDWNQHSVGSILLTESSESLDFSQNLEYKSSRYSSLGIYTDFSKISISNNAGAIFTSDGRFVKVWKSLDTFKASSLGKSNIYYSSGYSGFDVAGDNSITFSGGYYMSTDYSHTSIQNSIDNSQTIDESTVNNIVNNYITNNNYGDSSGSGSGGGSGSGSGGWWDIGSGIASFIEGVASLLDFILKLLGDLIGLLGTFLTSVLDVFSSLTALGQGFGDFLGAAFSFLPEECISLIVSSIAAMCIVGVVKVFIK